ncbi:MAG: gliding motility-associated C-terminal domain-containing protein, partial [Flavobacterium sp.]
GNVTNNDTLNGQVVTSSNTDVTTITTGPLSIDGNGVLTLAPNTVSGTYTIVYQLCETGAVPSNCDTATATVVVGNPIIADDDTTYSTQVTAATTTTVGNVTDNDTLNGLAVTASNTDVTPITTGPLSIDGNGVLTLAPNTVSGTYTIVYQLCESGAVPSNCDTATATVVVGNPIIANDDTTYSTQVAAATTTTVGNVTENDILNGLAVTASNTDVAPITTGPLSIDANGVLTLAANTVSGTYTIVYQLCETGAVPSNCDTATATVVVGNPIVANTDNTFAIQITTTTATTVGNVTGNDTLNGLAVSASNTDVTPITTGPLSIDTNGVLTLEPNTVSGTYTILYQLCETGAVPSNCDTATATVVVGNPIVANTDNTFAIQVTAATTTTVGNVTNNDTLNGQVVTSSNTDVTPITTGPLSIGSDGVLTLAPNTVSGTYNIVYQLCETGAVPSNCDTATATVVVGNPIVANADNIFATQITTTTATTVGNVTDNDTLNGQVVTSSNTNVTPITTGPLSIDGNGVLTLAPNTVSGTYNIVYQLCEEGAVPSNCDTATATVVVDNKIVAANDGLVTVDGINGSLEFINILDNDLLNGLPINASDVNISKSSSPYFEFNSDGTVNVKPNTPGGNYPLIYQVCEKANPSNCDSATLNVFVEVPAIAIIKTATFNDTDNSGFANAGETITYNFKVTNTGNVPLSGVTVTDPLTGIVMSGQAISLAVNESDEHTFSATYTILQSDINKGNVTNQATVKGNSVIGVVVEDKSDKENNLEDNPTVLDIKGCEIKVFNAVSPNDDGDNDEFYIRGIECYPDNTVEIYNRWGVLVYEKDHYDNINNAFKGMSEGRTTIKISEGLPVGTYFYILKYKDSDAKQNESSGYLYLSK